MKWPLVYIKGNIDLGGFFELSLAIIPSNRDSCANFYQTFYNSLLKKRKEKEEKKNSNTAFSRSGSKVYHINLVNFELSDSWCCSFLPEGLVKSESTVFEQLVE